MQRNLEELSRQKFDLAIIGGGIQGGAVRRHVVLIGLPGSGKSTVGRLVAAGRPGEAGELFQTEAVGIPAAVVAQMRNAPFRPALEKMAPTLVYESLILKSLPAGLIASVRIPTLVIDGEQSPEVMRHAAQSLADGLPDGRYRTLQGQGHDIVPAVVAPVMEEFFLAQS